ncbi:BlaI/MecI/CopY family transcriptional regulator [Mucilaginibacter boryungensis]|nr:BlaI/MecI/CopY family transcriptional regulator [Mucilaginibacter boryungensis]
MMEKENKTEDNVPTRAELEALKILWAHGPSTVRFVHDMLTRDTKTVRYTSTLKMMQLMTEKGMVKRDESRMTHVYYPLLEEKQTMGTIAERFVQSMYNGSISNLLVAFMNNKPSSAKELEQVKELLKKLDQE